MLPTTIMMYFYLLLCVTMGKLFRKNFLYKRSLFAQSQPFKLNHKIVVIKQTFESMYKFKAMKYHFKYHIFTKLKKIMSAWMDCTKIWFCFVHFFSIISHYLVNIAQVLFIGLVFSHISNINSSIMNNFANFKAIVGNGRIGMAHSGNFTIEHVMQEIQTYVISTTTTIIIIIMHQMKKKMVKVVQMI